MLLHSGYIIQVYFKIVIISAYVYSKYVTVSKCFGAPNKKGVMYVAFFAQPKKKRLIF